MERPASLLGVIDYNAIDRLYDRCYALWGIGAFSIFELSEHPKWAKRATMLKKNSEPDDGSFYDPSDR